jgi:hypothetical protein
VFVVGDAISRMDNIWMAEGGISSSKNIDIRISSVLEL